MDEGNESLKFPNNVPPKNLRLWWDRKHKTWRIWFGDDVPMYADGEFTPFVEPLFYFEQCKELAR
jgi:hypothetical protein